MEELLDMMVTDESPSQISDTIKDLLYAKTAARVDAFRQVVAGSTLENQIQRLKQKWRLMKWKPK